MCLYARCCVYVCVLLLCSLLSLLIGWTCCGIKTRINRIRVSPLEGGGKQKGYCVASMGRPIHLSHKGRMGRRLSSIGKGYMNTQAWKSGEMPSGFNQSFWAGSIRRPGYKSRLVIRAAFQLTRWTLYWLFIAASSDSAPAILWRLHCCWLHVPCMTIDIRHVTRRSVTIANVDLHRCRSRGKQWDMLPQNRGGQL